MQTLRYRIYLLLLLLTTHPLMANENTQDTDTTSPLLTCAVQLTQAKPMQVYIDFNVTNPNTHPVYLQKIGTPFEGWKTRFLTVTLNEQPLDYQGPMIKRSAPQFPDDFMRIDAGKTHTQRLLLNQAYTLPNIHKEQTVLHVSYRGIFNVILAKEPTEATSTNDTQFVFPECAATLVLNNLNSG